MDINSLITDSRVAFLNGQFANSLEIALQAVKADQTSADAYTCAANACMSLEKYEQAVEYYKSAVRNEPNNGDRYFFLGYAYASVNKTVDAIKALTKAEELKCSKENLATLYQLMGLVCFDAGKIDDALINLKKAEYCEQIRTAQNGPCEEETGHNLLEAYSPFCCVKQNERYYQIDDSE